MRHTNVREVVSVYTESALRLVTYTYDAWGYFTTTYYNGGANTPAAKNPFTYRGYYFDRDLGLYYLNSRYYDSVICRFINADRQISFGNMLLGSNMFSYCENNPVVRSDYNGEFFDYVIDAIFLGIGISDFVSEPTWEKAAWLSLDITLTVIPFVPAISSVRRADDPFDLYKVANKVDNISDFTKAYGHIDNFADSGGTIRKANKLDFSNDGWNMVQGLSKTADGFTISNHVTGTKIHYTFMNNGKNLDKTCRCRYRVDGINYMDKIIYELKPYNPRGIKKGIKQLYRYNEFLGGGYRMVLVLY